MKVWNAIRAKIPVKLLVPVAAALLTACGNPGELVEAHLADIETLEGFWLVDAVTLATPNDTKRVEYSRNAPGASVRADVVVTADDPLHGTLELRLATVDNGVLTSNVRAEHYEVKADRPGHWIFYTRTPLVEAPWQQTHIDPAPRRYVYGVITDGETTWLTWDARDGRNTATPPIRYMQLSRSRGWSQAMVGTWDVAGAACERRGDLFTKTRVRYQIDERLLVTQQMTTDYFVDRGCGTRVIDARTQTSRYGLAEEAVPIIRIWLAPNQPETLRSLHQGYFAEYRMKATTPPGSEITQWTWLRLSCAPQNTCDTRAPEELVLREATGFIANPFTDARAAD